MNCYDIWVLKIQGIITDDEALSMLYSNKNVITFEGAYQIAVVLSLSKMIREILNKPKL